MAWEEVVGGVIGGGVVAIVATYFGSWLQARETKTQKEERERRLRSLLAGEISSNVSQMITGRKIETSFEEIAPKQPRLGYGPTEFLLSKIAYNGLVSDPTFLDETTTRAVLEAYDAFESVNLAVKGYVEATKPEEKQLMYAFWKDLTIRAEEKGHKALEAFGATSEITNLKGYRT